MALVLITPPQQEPVSVADCKTLARIDQREEDDLIASLIRAVRLELDGPYGWLGRALMTQQWDMILDHFPCAGEHVYSATPAPGFVMPLPPLQSVGSITYLDTAGVTQTVDPTTYVVDPTSQPGRVYLKAGKVWPATQAYTPNAVTVRFTAGYGRDAASVPERIREWLKRAVAFKYETRQLVPMPALSFWDLADYRVAWAF